MGSTPQRRGLSRVVSRPCCAQSVRTYYPGVPQAFGGGEPYVERLVIGSNSGTCELLQLGFVFPEEEPNTTEPVPVLHESDKLVAVQLRRSENRFTGWVSDNVVVQIDKSLISATEIYANQHAPTPVLQPIPWSVLQADPRCADQNQSR